MEFRQSRTIIATVVLAAIFSLNAARAGEVNTDKPEAKPTEAASANIPSPEECLKDTPKVIKPMEDYSIIATNTATIDTSPSFSGSRLKYSYSANSKKANVVKIDKDKGIITIDAEKSDNFNISVTAKNACGIAVTKFNVQIDEET